jgi:GGDEF domain-containing protein
VRTVTGHQVRISASAGISYVRARDADAVDTPTVIARADRAMLRAKRGGKSTFRLASGPQSVVREFDLAGEERKVEDNAVEALTAPDR